MRTDGALEPGDPITITGGKHQHRVGYLVRQSAAFCYCREEGEEVRAFFGRRKSRQDFQAGKKNVEYDPSRVPLNEQQLKDLEKGRPIQARKEDPIIADGNIRSDNAQRPDRHDTRPLTTKQGAGKQAADQARVPAHGCERLEIAMTMRLLARMLLANADSTTRTEDQMNDWILTFQDNLTEVAQEMATADQDKTACVQLPRHLDV